MSTINYLIGLAKELPALHVALYFLIINLATFLTYRRDKNAAAQRGWRVPESTLHFLMFIGGTVGAFWAQKKLRHKTRKQSFRVIFWLLFMMQLAGLFYIMTV